jgi:transcriptional repressor NrdR
MPHVIKRDGRREPFDDAKLRGGIVASLQKRPIASETIEAAIVRVTHRLQTLGEREVDSRFVGDLVMDELRGLDEVAYVRFASIYRSFQAVSEFQDEIQRLRSLPDALANREQMSLLPEDDE